MKKLPFTGSGVALITPFNPDGTPNYEKLKELVEMHVANKTDAIIVCGTTGEASTLSDPDHLEVIGKCVEYAAGRICIIGGTGSNDTKHAIDFSVAAEKLGCDGVLCVTPYYNKCTQKGLVAHYTAIADSINIPVILYNVPSRTGVNIEPATYKALMNHENIIAIKEANGNISKIVETMSYVHENLDIYSGNDDQIVPIMSLGGKGVISVVSNLLPKKTVEMCKHALDGNYPQAAKMQYELHALIDSLFCEVNPIPVKAAMAKMGYGTDTLRLPLTSMTEANREKMFKLMREQGINI